MPSCQEELYITSHRRKTHLSTFFHCSSLYPLTRECFLLIYTHTQRSLPPIQPPSQLICPGLASTNKVQFPLKATGRALCRGWAGRDGATLFLPPSSRSNQVQRRRRPRQQGGGRVAGKAREGRSSSGYNQIFLPFFFNELTLGRNQVCCKFDDNLFFLTKDVTTCNYLMINRLHKMIW